MPAREVIRARLIANALGASGCAFIIGSIFAPMMRYWRGAIWASFAVFVLGAALCYRAYRLWGRFLAELDRPRERCSSCDHETGTHSKGGCWYAVTTGSGRSLTCPCTVVPDDATELT